MILLIFPKSFLKVLIGAIAYLSTTEIRPQLQFDFWLFRKNGNFFRARGKTNPRAIGHQ
jgi:hypothetical protein